MESSSVSVKEIMAKLPKRRFPQHNPIETRSRLYSFLYDAGHEHRDCTFDSFVAEDEQQHAMKSIVMDYAANIRKMWDENRGIMLYGSSGDGKDHLLMAAAKAAFEAGAWVHWVNGISFRSRVRETIVADDTEENLIREMMEPEFLWMSDPTVGGKPLTPFQSEFLYRIVDTRNRQQRPIWLSANVHSGESLSKLVGAATFDRLRDRVVSYHCDWESFRQPGRA